MKHIILFFSFVLNLLTCNSQENSFTLGIVFPDKNNNLGNENLAKIETKLSNIINKSGVATVGYDNPFVIYPILTIEDSEVVQGGLESMTITTIEITLNITDIVSAKSYGSLSKKLKGTGKNELAGLNNAISQLKPDKDIIDFIKAGKIKIIEYFDKNCSIIVSKAKNAAAKKNFTDALLLLESIPIESKSCYSETQKLSLSYFNSYQNQNCKNNIGKAKSEIVLKNYDTAIDYLMLIGSDTPCFSEADKLIKSISDKVDQDTNKELDLEKRRLDAVKEIGKAYYSNLAKNSGYTIISY